MEQETPEITQSTNKALIGIIVGLVIVLSAVVVWGYYKFSEDASVPDEEQVFVTDNLEDIDNDEVGDLVYDADATVYVTIYSHNEDSWESKVNTEEKYFRYREALIDRAHALAKYDVEWNWQSDQPVIEAMAEYEDDPEFRAVNDLSGDADKNVLEYLETLGVHFDPHAHKNNYADIAYLMEEHLGVDATSVIGGLTHVECGREYLDFLDYMSWHDAIDLQSDGYVYGDDYPDAKWKPEILSDPGMGGHWFDDYSSGVWKPGDEDDFYSHYPNSDIAYIGEGYPHDVTIIGEHHASGAAVWSEDGAYIKELVGKIESAEFPTGVLDGPRFMYTASVHIRDTDVVTEGGNAVNTVEGINSFMDEMQALRDSGKVIFVDFEEAARIWEEEYDSEPYFVNLESFSFYEELKSEAFGRCAEEAHR